jgi:hypothetical protein
MHARYFSAHLGRCHSVDPVGAAPSWPQSWNRYSYVLGNPMKYVDPEGLWPFFPIGDIPYIDEIEVIGELIPLPTRPFNPFTGVQGLSDLLSGRSLLTSLSSQGARRSSTEGRRLRSNSGDTPGIIGFGCDDLISPAAALGSLCRIRWTK